MPPLAAAAGMAAFLCGCVINLGELFRAPREDDDLLFRPEIVEMMIKEPTIIPGMVLLIEVTAGGLQVVPGGAKVVSLRGDIVMPLVAEPVDCSGLTLRELTDKLTEAYAQLYQQPSISVMFGPVGADGSGVSAWGTVGVYGCVGREGIVNLPPTSRLTLTQAIQFSGGLTPFANRKKIQVTRTATPRDLPQLQDSPLLKNGKLQQTKFFNYNDISNGAINDPPLLKDDVIRAHETIF